MPSAKAKSNKYQFAKSEAGLILSISDIDKNDRKAHGQLTCLGCGREMETSMGDQVAHHFRHKSSTDTCSRESYLHMAAKHTVAQAFNAAVAEGRPFYLIRTREAHCNKWLHVVREPCVTEEVAPSIDLTKWFTEARIEQGARGYIADVLLVGKGHEIAVEIKVSHACDQEKIDSGLKIIEVDVEDESDIGWLRLGLDATSEKTRLYNISPLSTNKAKRCQTCPMGPLSVKIEYKSGKDYSDYLDPYHLMRLLTRNWKSIRLVELHSFRGLCNSKEHALKTDDGRDYRHSFIILRPGIRHGDYDAWRRFILYNGHKDVEITSA